MKKQQQRQCRRRSQRSGRRKIRDRSSTKMNSINTTKVLAHYNNTVQIIKIIIIIILLMKTKTMFYFVLYVFVFWNTHTNIHIYAHMDIFHIFAILFYFSNTITISPHPFNQTMLLALTATLFIASCKRQGKCERIFDNI